MRYCPTARNFYRIRGILMETLGLPRHAIRLESTFAELIPPQDRQRVRQLLRKEKLDVLSLSMSSRQKAMSCLAASAGILLGLGSLLLPSTYACLGCVGSILVIILTLYLTERFLARSATELDSFLTIRGGVVAGTRAHHYSAAGHTFTKEELFIRVRDVVARSAGVNPAMITRKTHFQKDLGLE